MAITLKAENLTESFSPPFKIPMWIISLHLSLTTQSCIEYRGVYNGVKVEQAPGKPPQFTLVGPLRILTTVPRMDQQPVPSQKKQVLGIQKSLDSKTNSIGTNSDPTINQPGDPPEYMQSLRTSKFSIM